MNDSHGGDVHPKFPETQLEALELSILHWKKMQKDYDGLDLEDISSENAFLSNKVLTAIVDIKENAYKTIKGSTKDGVFTSCFLCDYAIGQTGVMHNGRCEKCPMRYDWHLDGLPGGNSKPYCTMTPGIYTKWMEDHYPQPVIDRMEEVYKRLTEEKDDPTK